MSIFDFFGFHMPQAHNGVEGFKAAMDGEKDSEEPDYRYAEHILEGTTQGLKRARADVEADVEKRTPEQQQQVEADRNWLTSLFR